MRALKAIGKFFLGLISFIICVALFASTLVTMLVGDIKVATNKDNLNNILNQMLSAPAKQVTMQPLNAAAGSDIAFDFSSAGLTDAIVEYAFDSIQEMVGDEAELDIEMVKAFVEESTLTEFLSDKTSSIVSDLYTGENTATITTEEIVGLIEENKTLIEEYFEIEIPEDQMEELKQVLDEIPELKQIEEQGITSIIMESMGGTAPEEGAGSTTDVRDTWYGSLPGFSQYVEEGGASNIMNNPVAMALEVVRFYTSDAVLWMCIGVCAVLIGLLFLCAWNKPYKAMIKSGVTLFLASIGFLVPTLIAWLAPATWMNLFSFEPTIGTVSRFILMLTGGVCGAVAGIGIALIAGGITVCVLMKKKKAALAAAAVEETAAVEEAATEEAPAEETAVEEAPAEEVSEEAVAEAEEAAEEASVEDAPAEEVPAEEAPAEETPAEETV